MAVSPLQNYLCRPAFIPAFCPSQRFGLWGLAVAPGFACNHCAGFKPFWPLAPVPRALAALSLVAFRGCAALFQTPSGLTRRSSRSAFGGRLTSFVRHLDQLMSSTEETTDRWLVVFNPYLADGLPSTRCGPAFFRLLQLLSNKIIETTPRTQFETFPHGIDGYNIMLIRFRLKKHDNWQLPDDWLNVDNSVASIVLSGAPKPSELKVVHRHNCNEELWCKFTHWLTENQQWFWKPRH